MSTIDDVSSLSPLAPVDPAGLSRALLPFGQSTMLPIESYTSPDLLAWERRHLVARAPAERPPTTSGMSASASAVIATNTIAVGRARRASAASSSQCRAPQPRA